MPVDETVLKGVHNLRHTFGHRPRAAGVPIETRQLLMGRANGNIVTHYSAAKLGEPLSAAEKVTDQGIAQTPALTLIQRHARGVGKESELGCASEPIIQILLADDRHDVDAVSGDPIVDAVCPTDAASITDSDIIDSRVG